MKKQIVVIATLAVCLVLGTAAFAKSNIGFKGVGAKIGFVGPEGGIGSTIAFGGVADLGWITPEIGLEADAVYWGKSYNTGFIYDTYDVKYSQFTISAIAKYYFAQKKGAKFHPYAGGGLGMGFWKLGYPSAAHFTGGVSGSDLVVSVVGGSKMALSPSMDGFAEFRYSTGGFDFWGVFAGVIFKLK
jgi:hypothetical protein